MEWQPPAEPLRAKAVEAAEKADLTVAFVGLSPNIEGEEMPVYTREFDGGDRNDIALPHVQEELLQALAATGKPLIVVYTSGSELASATAQNAARALLMAWYPGQAGGTAIAETLGGENNPSGRLPVTFYKSIADLPGFSDYSMSNRTYRYFKGEPLYGFGYGLSYARFAYGPVTLASKTLQAGEALEARVSIRNTSQVEGDEVAELYLRPPQTPGALRLALEGFERLHLLPGEEKQVRFQLDARQMSTVDAAGKRMVQPGSYHVFVGGAQPAATEADSAAAFTINGSYALPE